MTPLACLTHWYISLLYVVPVLVVGGWGWWSSNGWPANAAPRGAPAASAPAESEFSHKDARGLSGRAEGSSADLHSKLEF